MRGVEHAHWSYKALTALYSRSGSEVLGQRSMDGKQVVDYEWSARSGGYLLGETS